MQVKIATTLLSLSLLSSMAQAMELREGKGKAPMREEDEDVEHIRYVPVSGFGQASMARVAEGSGRNSIPIDRERAAFEHADRLIEKGYNQDPHDEGMMASLEKHQPEDIKILVETYTSCFRKAGPSVVLFSGPPGTGKSSYAKFIAQKIGAPYIFITAAKMGNEYQNTNQLHVEQIFSKALLLARKQRHVLIFDEINQLLEKKNKKRKNLDQGVSEIVWTNLDSLEKQYNLIVFGTGNDLTKYHSQVSDRIPEIVFFKNNYNPEVTRDIIEYHLREFPTNLPEAHLNAFLNKIKNVPMRSKIALVKRAMRFAIYRASSKADSQIEKPDLDKSLVRHYENSKAFQPSFHKNFYKIINKRVMPILNVANGTLNLFQASTSMWATIAQLQNARRGLQLQAEGIDISREGVNISKEGLEFQKSEAQLNHQAQSRAEEIQRANLNAANVNRDLATAGTSIVMSGAGYYVGMIAGGILSGGNPIAITIGGYVGGLVGGGGTLFIRFWKR